MKFTLAFTFSCLVVVVLVAFSGQAFADSTAVGLCSAAGTHYTTIQAAVNAAEALTPPSTVRVCHRPLPRAGIDHQEFDVDGGCRCHPCHRRCCGAAAIWWPRPKRVRHLWQSRSRADFRAGPGDHLTVSGLTVDGTGNNITGCAGPGSLRPRWREFTSKTLPERSLKTPFETNISLISPTTAGVRTGWRSTLKARVIPQ